VTPAEYAVSLGRVAGLSRLTELFMDARYGPDEPPAESVAAAETAADEALRDLRNSKSLSRRVHGGAGRRN
jgi:hypothetical protein